MQIWTKVTPNDGTFYKFSLHGLSKTFRYKPFTPEGGVPQRSLIWRQEWKRQRLQPQLRYYLGILPKKLRKNVKSFSLDGLQLCSNDYLFQVRNVKNRTIGRWVSFSYSNSSWNGNQMCKMDKVYDHHGPPGIFADTHGNIYLEGRSYGEQHNNAY